MSAAYWPDVGDVVWTDLDPRVGREQSGRRPALVVYGRTFAEHTGFAILCPITSRVRPFPTSVVLPPQFPIAGEILLSNIRSVDLFARTIRFSGHKVDANTAAAVREKLNTLIVI
jgi:mRNA interferase MazF